MRRFFCYFFVGCLTFTIGALLAKVAIPASSSPPSHVPEAETTYDFLSPSLAKKQIEHPPKIAEVEFKKPSCNDSKVRPIWNELRRNKEFREDLDYANGSQDCKDILEIYEADLNRDGKKEILVRGGFCGAVGNCRFWVLKKSTKGYRILIASSDYIDRSDMGDQIRKTTTKGYADLLLKGHFSAGETSFSYYKYDGRQYRESKCLYELPVSYNGDEPVWGFITCKQFYRRIDEEIAGRRPR